jgi:hypothetical protein
MRLCDLQVTSFKTKSTSVAVRQNVIIFAWGPEVKDGRLLFNF